jgi:hypothetical protein
MKRTIFEGFTMMMMMMMMMMMYNRTNVYLTFQQNLRSSLVHSEKLEKELDGVLEFLGRFIIYYSFFLGLRFLSSSSDGAIIKIFIFEGGGVFLSE